MTAQDFLCKVPPCQGVAAASTKRREATEAPQTGWSITRKCFKTHCETCVASDPPVRASSERDHFFDGAATPPWQGGESARLIHSHLHRPRLQLILRFCNTLKSGGSSGGEADTRASRYRETWQSDLPPRSPLS